MGWLSGCKHCHKSCVWSSNPVAVVPSTATVVIVVCVSFLVFMIILGVFRIRAAHQRTMRDQDTGKENEMDWDDSALTITVNPMEVGAKGPQMAERHGDLGRVGSVRLGRSSSDEEAQAQVAVTSTRRQLMLSLPQNVSGMTGLSCNPLCMASIFLIVTFGEVIPSAARSGFSVTMGLCFPLWLLEGGHQAMGSQGRLTPVSLFLPDI